MKKTHYRFSVIVLSFIYFLVMGLIFFINSPIGLNGTFLAIGQVKIPTYAIAGCLNAILLVLVSLIVIVSNGKSWVTAIILQLLQMMIVLFSVLKVGNFSSIPGIIMIIFGIILVVILKTYIQRIVSNEQELDRMSLTDSLTGLPNRRALMRKMGYMQAQEKKFFLIFLDLDNFKIINDTLGHDKGDELLKFVSAKWAEVESISSDFHLYRLGGDEFALIVEIDNEVLLFDICTYIISCLGESENEFSGIVTCSAGYAKFPDDTRSIADLLTYADTAMYKAKNAGKNQLKKFDKAMFSELVTRFNLEKDLKMNLGDGAVKLVYQGQNDARTGEQYGWEILSRMTDRYGNDVSPADFIGTAEKSTLIYEIDKYVLENALAQTEEYFRNGGQGHISVNISGKHVIAPNFVDDMFKIFEKHPDFPYSLLTIEITESSYVKNIEKAQIVLERIKQIGCKIALDDFGTGYSSLCYLSMLPIDYIKIDKSFIDKLLDEDTLVKIIIQLGHLLGLTVIAEGVESQEQLDKLNDLGCDLIQGFIFGKARSWEEWNQR